MIQMIGRARHLAEVPLPPGKTLDGFNFDVVRMISKALVVAICAGDNWIGKSAVGSRRGRNTPAVGRPVSRISRF